MGPNGELQEVTKQRDLETAGEFSFRLQRVELGDNDRGKPVTSCVVQHLEEHEIGASRIVVTLASRLLLLGALRGGGA